MANNDLVRDPDEDELRARAAEELRARQAMAAGAGGAGVATGILPNISGRGAELGGGRALPPLGAPPDITGTLPPASETLPSIGGIRGPRAPAGTSEATQEELGQIRWEREHPLGTEGSRMPGTKGKILHGLAKAGEVAADVFDPGLMATIPGTPEYRNRREVLLTRQLGEQQREEREAPLTAAQTEETLQRTAASKAAMGQWKPVPTQTRTDPDTDEQQMLWERPGETRWGPMEGTGPLPTGGETIPRAQAPPPAAPTAPPPTATGLPPQGAPAAVAAAAQTPTPAPRWQYGKPGEGERRLTADEIARQDAANLERYRANNPNATTLPPAFQLGPRATNKDVDRIDRALESTERAGATAAQQAFTREEKRKSDILQEQAAQERRDKANAEWVRAVDNDNKVHLMTRGDYAAHPHDFKPYPGTMERTEVDKVTADAKRLNEMQGAMNAAAEAIHNYGYDQNDLVVQALQRTEESYPDKVIGIPIVDYLAQNLKKLGLSGANNNTREYIINLLSLREAMLALPKEITEGSRQVQSSIEALYSTLPGGTTPDRDYAMRQMYRVQGILDRVRGTTIPIVEGMRMVGKLPELYKYKGIKGGQPVFSDDNKEWVDERGNTVK